MITKYLLSLSLAALHIALCYGKSVCADKQIIETTKLTTVNGKTISMKRFNCSTIVETSVDDLGSRESPYVGRNMGHAFRRSAAQCTQANCMCGLPVTFNRCATPAQPIKSSDCTTLANGLLAVSNPATFIIPSGQGAAFFVETCEAEVTNPISSPMQYCFSDMGINTLSNTNICTNLEAVASGTFAGNGFFFGLITP